MTLPEALTRDALGSPQSMTAVYGLEYNKETLMSWISYQRNTSRESKVKVLLEVINEFESSSLLRGEAK